ncbi:triosephosphate isomerase [Grosmannia clavigera kw1407]|uniref:Triosephosphate isomerase n=1 Tax=Grosmannia clavigera (strain kw1407 / UAMH 11150) TaxID=655863 RepID=F0XPC6_GROCL|nr:triosephosphate isomerase [Grosmannia clavigera kw1407]EFX00516.1 triosephosphate isomerase [Grosmannia clavigera kw1407]
MAERRRPIVGVSTKMYFSLARTRDYTKALIQRFAADEDANTIDQRGRLLDRVDVFVLPDFVSLAAVVGRLQASGLGLQAGAQDCGSDDYGAFTGVISPAVLAELGVRIVEIGHAERRRLFGETDASTAAKATAIVRNGMVPLVCIGEDDGNGEISEDERVPLAIATVVAQVTPVLAAIPDDADVLLAYEPVWAIGAARPASAAHVRAVVTGLRASAAVRRRAAARTRILYGGSAGPGLFTQLAGVVDGLFLGRFGHDPDIFLQTVREVGEHA